MSSQAQHDELEFELPKPKQVSGGRLSAILGGVLVLLVLAFVIGFLPRFTKKQELGEESEGLQHAVPRVTVTQATILTSDRALELPAVIQALEETTLYPRADGYVRRWLVDIGDHVKEGQLLAEIDTPELDAQLEQARADLAQAEANKLKAETSASLSTTEQARYEALTPAGVASRQELEQRRAQAKVDASSIKVATATIAAQQASVRRLTQLKSFARLVAPFSGTIVARSIERGALVNPNNTTPLYKLAATDPVRVMVQVPQDVAPSIRVGVAAKLAVREYPGRQFDGVVSRAAGALDDATRTMTTEVRVPNPKGELLPGMYVRAALSLAAPHRLYEVPSTALYNDSQGTRVALLTAENKVMMRKIGIERDTGKTIQISSGLDGSERIVTLASAALGEGQTVDVISPEPKREVAKK
jgi:RND family efflux transporter MFP subunit